MERVEPQGGKGFGGVGATPWSILKKEGRAVPEERVLALLQQRRAVDRDAAEALVETYLTAGIVLRSQASEMHKRWPVLSLPETAPTLSRIALGIATGECVSVVG